MSDILIKEDVWFHQWFKKFVLELNDQKEISISEQAIEKNLGQQERQKEEGLMLSKWQAIFPETHPSADLISCVTTANQNKQLPFLYVQNASALLNDRNIRNRVLTIKMILHLDDESLQNENKWLMKIRRIMDQGCRLEMPKTQTRFFEDKMDKGITDKKNRTVKLDFKAEIIWEQ